MARSPEQTAFDNKASEAAQNVTEAFGVKARPVFRDDKEGGGIHGFGFTVRGLDPDIQVLKVNEGPVTLKPHNPFPDDEARVRFVEYVGFLTGERKMPVEQRKKTPSWSGDDLYDDILEFGGEETSKEPSVKPPEPPRVEENESTEKFHERIMALPKGTVAIHGWGDQEIWLIMPYTREEAGQMLDETKDLLDRATKVASSDCQKKGETFVSLKDYHAEGLMYSGVSQTEESGFMFVALDNRGLIRDFGRDAVWYLTENGAPEGLIQDMKDFFGRAARAGSGGIDSGNLGDAFFASQDRHNLNSPELFTWRNELNNMLNGFIDRQSQRGARDE